MGQATIHTVGADGTFDGRLPRYGGLNPRNSRYICRIDGRMP